MLFSLIAPALLIQQMKLICELTDQKWRPTFTALIIEIAVQNVLDAQLDSSRGELDAQTRLKHW